MRISDSVVSVKVAAAFCLVAVLSLPVSGSEHAAPARHRPKMVMGRDYWTALYPHYDHAAGAAWSDQTRKVRFDNEALNGLPFVKDSIPVYHALRKAPSAESGKATWRHLIDNFEQGEPDAEIVGGNPKPDRPLIVGFGSKRDVLNFGGEIDLDYGEWSAWKRAHPNLLCCWSHIEWDNTVPATYERVNRIADGKRRSEVLAFLGERPKNRYERLEVQRRFFDRMMSLYYGDTSVAGVMFASLYTGHIAAGFGARTVIVETTNTSGGDKEYRWNLSAMFARGAARQFDLPWEWYVAIYMNGQTSNGGWWNNAVCCYPANDEMQQTSKNGYNSGPDFGVSRSLQNRAFYFAYLNGANFVEQEEWSAVFQRWDSVSKRTVLSPRGEDFARYHDFTRRHPERGTPWTPVAILIPYAQGYPTYGGYPWATSQYGYTAGDYAVDAVFFTLVPGFERAKAMRKGIEANLHNTPFAHMYDVICPDAPQKPEELLDVLKSYKALVIAGDYPDKTFESSIREYEKGGGEVVRIGAALLPPQPQDAVPLLHRGALRFPSVERTFKALQDRYFPFAVHGDCLYGANRTEKGWWLWVFNNKGVEKFADAPQRIDPDAAVEVDIVLPKGSSDSVRELLTGRLVPVDGGNFKTCIQSGALAIFEVAQ